MSKERTPSNDISATPFGSAAGAIGHCLDQALDDLISEAIAQQSEDDATDPISPFDSVMSERVKRSLDHAVVRSSTDEQQWKDCPAALLRGRVHHYNKFSTKWRIVVEDVELCARPPSVPASNKRQKISLWQQADKHNKEPVTKVDGSLQILAFNDS